MGGRSFINCIVVMGKLQCEVNSKLSHLSISPRKGNGPTQGQRKTVALTRVGFEPAAMVIKIQRCRFLKVLKSHS